MAGSKKYTIKRPSLVFRNFAGMINNWNPIGRREFGVILKDASMIKELNDLGFNVKYITKLDDEDPDMPYLMIKAHHLNVSESTITSLDKATLPISEITFHGWEWEIGDKKGVVAILDGIKTSPLLPMNA